MSKTTKKKFVTTQLVLQNVELENGQFVAKIISSRGNNLHEVMTAEDSKFLVSMPTKFRRTLWVRRGNFVILQPIEEGDKVKAEIVHVMDVENVAYLLEKGQWPPGFAAEAEMLTSRRAKADEESADDMFPPTSSEGEEDDDDGEADDEEEEGEEADDVEKTEEEKEGKK